MSRDPWSGKTMLSFKVSDELEQMIEAARVHEHRDRSNFLRRAVMSYMAEAGYFDPRKKLNAGGSVVRDLVEQAKREIDK